jgi:hypothetical protein
MNNSHGSFILNIIIVLLIILFCSNALLLYLQLNFLNTPQTYDDCISTGGKIRYDINPLICSSSKGALFVQSQSISNTSTLQLISTPIPSPIPTRIRPHANDGCQIGGCSNELCLEGSDTTTTSTCDVKPYFVCYRNSICGRQTNGRCGWNMDSVLKSCLESYGEK